MTEQQTINLKAFRKANKLTQANLAEIIGISRSFISLIESGVSKLPDKYLQTLLTLKEFDTSMLKANTPLTNISARASGNSSARVSIGNTRNDDRITVELAIAKSEIESLRSQLSEEKQRSAQYWEMIQKLMK